jgi:hypothetical protein
MERNRSAQRPIVRIVGAIASLALLSRVTGCSDSGRTDAIVVANHTSQTLHFQVVRLDGKAFDLGKTAAPGETVVLIDVSYLQQDAGMGRSGCTVGDLTALGPDGSLVKRFPPPVCAPVILSVGQEPASSGS